MVLVRPEDEWMKCQKYLNKEKQEGSIWYIISQVWWHKWNNFIHRKLSDPGKVNNEEIMDGNSLKSNLEEGRDVVIVPQKVWSIFVFYHDTVHTDRECKIFKRTMIRFGGRLIIEIYPATFWLGMHGCDWERVDFVDRQSLGDAEVYMRRLFGVKGNRETRLVATHDDGTPYLLDCSKSKFLKDVQKQNIRELVLDVKNKYGRWYYDLTESGSWKPVAGRKLVTPSRRHTPGVCGLSNLGNTCFMSSALQCLSHVPEITDYFLSDTWRKELNEENPLGMKGEIARAFAGLIRDMWSGDFTEIAPATLKEAIGKFAPQFAGFAQQDLQHFLSFLLDGLHEDLNRVRQRPTIKDEDNDERPEKEVAVETWNNHLSLNNSIVTDTFHGLLKSRLQCPDADCGFISFKFEPFALLSLPLPEESERLLWVTFVPRDPTRNLRKMHLKVTGHGSVRDLTQALGMVQMVNEDSLIIVAGVTKDKITKILPNETPVDEIESTFVYMYEVRRFDSDKQRILPVNFRKRNRGDTFSEFTGHPLLIVVPVSGFTWEDLADILYARLKKCINDSQYSLDPDTWEIIHHEPTENVVNGYQENGTSGTHEIIGATFNVFIYDEDTLHEREIKSVGVNYSVGRKEKSCLNLQLKANAEVTFPSSEMVMNWGRRSEDPVRLEDCFGLFTSEERLSGQDLWECRKCKAEKEAYKKFDLWHLPNVLILQLKRYYFRKQTRNKIDSLITFPLSGLDLSSYIEDGEVYIYDLAAVSNHTGSLECGHYTTCAKSGTQWYRFDDTRIRTIKEKDVMTRDAVVLMYLRRPAAERPKSVG